MLEVTVQDQINSPHDFSCPFWYNMRVAFLRSLARSTRNVIEKTRSQTITLSLSKEFQQ